MKSILMGLLIALATVACQSPAPQTKKESNQDIRIYTTSNTDKAITTKTIEAAFAATGFSIDGNNNMNKPFSKRFGTTWYETYHLFTVHNADIVAKLIAKYPRIGLLTPLSMSIWSSNDNKSMSISALSLRGISRMTQIPMDNPDLIALADLLDKALKAALPGGHYEDLSYKKVASLDKPLQTYFETEFEADEDGTFDTAKDDFQAEFEGEMEPVGFLFPGFIGVKDEVVERGVDIFDFYDTYSVCKLEVIHPVSKTHPEVGAFAPCTFYMYKLKSEKKVHMGYPSVDNWITATDLEDDYSLKPLIEAENLFQKIVKSIIE